MIKKNPEIISPTRHSEFGGSKAAQYINCPASIGLSRGVPEFYGSGGYATEGLMLHAAIAACLDENVSPDEVLGFELDEVVLTKELLEGKLRPALNALDEEIDPEAVMEFAVEQEVSFGKYLPGVFGSVDLVGRRGDTAIVLDWKFGHGLVIAENNPQLLFYAAAAMRTDATKWAFDGATEIELVIVQPMSVPMVSRWTCLFSDITKFERVLKASIKEAQGPNPRLQQGDHCKYCRAKAAAKCPIMNGAMERALKADLQTLDVEKLGKACRDADLVEDLIKKLRQMVQTALENGVDVPGWKLVTKRGTRQWVNEEGAYNELVEQGLTDEDLTEQKFRSPAQVEKVLKSKKLTLPEGLVSMVSKGHTIAHAEDPRPAVNRNVQLANALKKL